MGTRFRLGFVLAATSIAACSSAASLPDVANLDTPGGDASAPDAFAPSPPTNDARAPSLDGTAADGDAGAGEDAALDGGAVDWGDASAFCKAKKAFLDRCGRDHGCEATNLAYCDKEAPAFDEIYKSAAVTCSATTACDAAFPDDIDPCIKASLAGVPRSPEQVKFEDDMGKICNFDSGVAPSRDVVAPFLLQEVDTMCLPLAKRDAGEYGCVGSIIGCELTVVSKYTFPDACKDGG